MGLDQNLYKKRKQKFPIVINNETELNYLVDDYYKEEVMYWRKNYDIQQFIADQIGIIENGEYYILSKDIVLKLIDFCNNYKEPEPEYQEGWKIMAEKIKKVYDETDFDKYNFVYESDW